MAEPSCATCRFSGERLHEGQAFAAVECRRYPPTNAGAPSRWPIMGLADWCGEYRAAAGHADPIPPQPLERRAPPIPKGESEPGDPSYRPPRTRLGRWLAGAPEPPPAESPGWIQQR